MKKALLIVLCMVLLAMVFSCGDDGPTVNTYTSTDKDGNTYTLEVTNGKTYVLTVVTVGEDGEDDVTITSTGKVTAKDGNKLTLVQNANGEEITIYLDGENIDVIDGDIAPDDDSKPLTPGEMVSPHPPIEGLSWTWFVISESGPNPDKKRGQSIFQPGDKSKMTNAVDDPNAEGKIPFKYTTEILDNDDNPITEDVFNFKGTTEVSSANRTDTSGARFPMLGWGAEPADPATLAALKKAYSYSFYVRLNSATASNWSFLSMVETSDFDAENGFDYGHWYGNKKGDSRTSGKNFTKDLEVGTWYKITVIMKKTAPSFNIDQAQWIYSYPPSPAAGAIGPFNQDKALKMQWQVPLQHQDGAGVTARNGEPYDITNGSYTFDLDFYGLTLYE